MALTLSLAAAAVCLADPNMGTWKLNEGKSKFSPGAAKNKTVVYEAAGDSVKVIVDGIDGAGKATHNEWTGKFDGKDYAVTGDPNFDMRAYKQVDDRTLDMTLKNGGKVVGTGKIVCLRRWQKSHRDHERDRRERQEVQELRGLRQEVIESSAHDSPPAG